MFSWSSGAKTFGQHFMYPKIMVFLGVRTCEVFVCSLAIVRVRVYYFDFFVFLIYVTSLYVLVSVTCSYIEDDQK